MLVRTSAVVIVVAVGAVVAFVATATVAATVANLSRACPPSRVVGHCRRLEVLQHPVAESAGVRGDDDALLGVSVVVGGQDAAGRSCRRRQRRWRRSSGCMW